MSPTEDAFRALARSSPWRWRTLHFTFEDHHWRVEAWLQRPGQLLVRHEGRKDFRVDDRDRVRRGTSSVLTRPASRTRRFGRGPRGNTLDQHLLRWPHQVLPQRRDDGLVAVRPGDWQVEYGDPMYQSYTWVAALDPVELSHHTSVTDVREEARLGRRTWRARVRAEEGYEPTCSCCALLWSSMSARDDDENYDGTGSWEPPTGTIFPEAYDVALDVQTGVVTELSPFGPTTELTGLRLHVHEVDADLDRQFPVRSRYFPGLRRSRRVASS